MIHLPYPRLCGCGVVHRDPPRSAAELRPYVGTVILDPGTDTDSYTDHAVRAWRATAGLWHAKDTADVATWQARANQAYDSGVWGSGTLWSADAGNDPGVFTNRYNAGVTAGANSMPAFDGQNSSVANDGAWHACTFASVSDPHGMCSGANITVPVTGTYAITTWLKSNVVTGDYAQIRIRVNGGVVATSSGSGASANTAIYQGASYRAALTAGDVINIDEDFSTCVWADGHTTVARVS